MKFTLFYPIKPNKINQGFGANPDYYQKFHDAQGNPLKGHDGIDFYAPHGTPVYATHDGLIHYEKDSHGGEGMAIRTNYEFDLATGSASFITLYWHLIGDTDPKYPSPISLDGATYGVKAGDLIGYANNTGAPFESTGDHLHFGLFPVDVNGNVINPSNGFNGRIDPEPYFNGFYAQDSGSVIALYKSLISVLQNLVNWYHR